jgi:hypothetical protein
MPKDGMYSWDEAKNDWSELEKEIKADIKEE